MKVGKHRIRRIRELVDARAQDNQSIDEKDDSDKEPDRNHVVIVGLTVVNIDGHAGRAATTSPIAVLRVWFPYRPYFQAPNGGNRSRLTWLAWDSASPFTKRSTGGSQAARRRPLAQKMGRFHSGKCPSLGNSVQP